jgi:hypothetical protein
VPAIKLTDTGEESWRETGDHVGVLGKTQSGAVFTADIHGGVAPQDTRSSFEIRGSEAWISLTSDHPYGFQAGYLKLMSNIPFATPEEPAVRWVQERNQRRRDLCSSSPRFAFGHLQHTRL